ncbi:DUF4214 domain-containing protein, partial [Candidatus Saccharibacteria bacterium]|nr:DUF4214 domain-containing protein [Candidatus Saccharibacteria bacterium]
YQNILKRNGDPSGMAYWTKKLDDKSWTRNRVLAQFAATAKITTADALIQMGKPTNEQFVQQLYVSLFARQADSGGLAYWRGQLDNNKLSRSDLLARFAVDESSMKALGSDFAAFLATAPRLTINQTAKKRQDERLFISAVRVNDAKKEHESIKGLVDAGRSNRDNAKKLASKRVPSRSDLSNIASYERTTRGYKNKVPNVQRKLKIWADNNSTLYTQAKTVSDWSPDLSSDGIKKNYDTVRFYQALANNISKDLDYLIRDIAKQYNSAEKKYEAEQRRLAEIARQKAIEAANKKSCTDRGGTWTSGRCIPISNDDGDEGEGSGDPEWVKPLVTSCLQGRYRYFTITKPTVVCSEVPNNYRSGGVFGNDSSRWCPTGYSGRTKDWSGSTNDNGTRAYTNWQLQCNKN